MQNYLFAGLILMALVVCYFRYRRPYKKCSIVQVQTYEHGIVTGEITRIKRGTFL